MYKTINTKFLTGGFLVVLMAGLALAGPVETIYRQLRGATVAAHANHTGIETATLTSAAWDATPEQVRATNGNPSVAAFAEFTSDDAVTCQLTVGLFQEIQSAPGTYSFLGIAGIATLTGSTTQAKAATDYVAESPAAFDTRGATHYDLRLTGAPAQGQVTVKHYPYGGSKRDEE
jgi:hypothetical protein